MPAAIMFHGQPTRELKAGSPMPGAISVSPAAAAMPQLALLLPLLQLLPLAAPGSSVSSVTRLLPVGFPGGWEHNMLRQQGEKGITPLEQGTCCSPGASCWG